jgi:hypothetical protein
VKARSAIYGFFTLPHLGKKGVRRRGARGRSSWLR